MIAIAKLRCLYESGLFTIYPQMLLACAERMSIPTWAANSLRGPTVRLELGAKHGLQFRGRLMVEVDSSIRMSAQNGGRTCC